MTIQKTQLENGIRVLSERMDGVRSVSVGVLGNVGPKDEQAEEQGYAHLVEHMLFQGTGDRDAKAIAEMMAVGGGAMGAFTARDYTVYHATVLDEYLPFALEVLGDMLCNSVVPETALDRQRSVILNEIAGHDDPISTVNDLLKARLWPNHPLGLPTAGSESSIQAVTRERLVNFMNQHYIADKLVIAAAGNIDHTSFVSQVRDSFWQMRKGELSVAPAAPEPLLGTVTARPRDLQQVYFALAWPAPAYTSPDRYAWHVFSSLYGGGPTSRLYQQLREERGLVYHIEAQYQAYGLAGAMVVEGATHPQTLIPVLAGILIELMGMGESSPDPDSFHRAVQSIISQHLVSGDSAYVRMSRLALQELYFGGAVASHDVVEGLQQLSSESIPAIAQSMMGVGLPTIALVGPVSEGLLGAVGEMLGDLGTVNSIGFVPEDGLTVPSSDLGLSSMASIQSLRL